MNRIIKFFALLVFLIGITPANAQTFPALSGRVVDGAHMLSDAQIVGLSAKLQNLETQTQRQMVVVTLPDLQGYDIADYGYKLGRAWKLGDKARDDGLLLIIAPKERKVRFEVGYGLEPVMTDAMSSYIIEKNITPLFRAGDFAGGINAGVDGAIAQLKLSPEEAAKVAAQAAQKKQQHSQGGDMSAIIFWFFIFFFVILPIIRSMRKGGRAYGRGGVGPVIIWGGGSGFGGGSGGSSWGGGDFGGGGGFSGGGGSFGGGGASGGW